MIILFGLAGSGKGTQGKILAEKFGWRWMSVGQAIRDTGEYDEIVNKGELVPDTEVIKIMDRQIRKAEAEGFDVVLDGYPRDVVQADYIMQNMAEKINGAVILDVPKQELYERLALRGRKDDQERENIDRRFKIFEQNICAIVPKLEEHQVVVEKVDGTGTIGEVAERLARVVKKMVPGATEQKSDKEGRKGE